MKTPSNEIYRILDAFLTEAKDQNGNYRSLDKLNKDRHLAIEALIRLFEEAYEEGRLKEAENCHGSRFDCHPTI